MSLNFSRIAQDTLNFVQNQYKSCGVFTLLFSICSLINLFVISSVQGRSLNFNVEEAGQLVFPLLLPTVLYLCAYFFLTLLFLCRINAISQGQLQPMSISTSVVIQSVANYFFYFISFTVLHFIIFLPLSLGTTQTLISVLSNGSSSVSVIGLLGMVMGIYIYIRLQLAPYIYLFETQKIGGALRTTWQRSRSLLKPLLGLFLIAYVAPNILSALFAHFAQVNMVLSVVFTFLNSLIYLLSLIFIYRFYQLVKVD